MKLKPDFKSINFKTFVYFILFAAVLMILLWTLQVIFLNSFYGIMKSNQTKTVAKELKYSYARNDHETFIDDVQEKTRSYDLDAYIINFSSGDLLYISYASPGVHNNDYADTILELYDRIIIGGSESAQMEVENERDHSKVLSYATVLKKSGGDEAFLDAEILYIFSPLHPVTSTQRIMTTTLIYVTIISLILAIILSIYLSTRITRPIRKITRSAERLAQGEYGVVFKGGHYTEINQLADTLNSASIELEKADMIQKDLVANVSHDLKTPLTMIRSYAEMIHDISGDDKEKRNAHLQVIMDESDRLNSLVNDLLTVSRLQSGKLSIEKAEFNLSQALKSIVQTYSIMEEGEGYHFNVDCPMDFIVYGDEEKIKQVLTNLITNAIKFTGEDKTIDISMKRRGRIVRCGVGDHGPGIASEDLDHIWERYYRSSSNMVRASEGSGLGLSIVKEILTLHNCSFGVDSTLGEGSTFWFEMDVVRTEKNS